VDPIVGPWNRKSQVHATAVIALVVSLTRALVSTVMVGAVGAMCLGWSAETSGRYGEKHRMRD